MDEWWEEDDGPKFAWARAHTPSDGDWVDYDDHSPITQEFVRQYDWCVMVNILYNTDYYVADEYGLDGFHGQVLFDTEKYRASYRDHYRFRWAGSH